MTGYVHSIESFGTVDGPGIRFVIFLKGCPLRCQYCHNPDTWDLRGGTEMTVRELLDEYKKNEAFYQKGGITVTGGEPLLQIDFVTELFTEAKKMGIHTCVDTSGITFNPSNEQVMQKFRNLCRVTDLFMLDIKHTDTAEHKKLTGLGNENILAFADFLNENDKTVWIRHVVVPGITDSEAEWAELGKMLSRWSNVTALDVLPYHTMGVHKYESLGIDYPLKDVPSLDKEIAKKARNVILAWRKKALMNR